MFKFFTKKKLDEDLLEELEEELILADIGMLASNHILNRLRKLKLHTDITLDELKAEVLKTLQDDLRDYFNHTSLLEHVVRLEKKPFVIMVCGTNGAGKTTTIAKLTNLFMNHGYKVLLSPCDTFRAGAKEQLQQWSDLLQCGFVDNDISNPSALAYKSTELAREGAYDVLIIDTAGRLDNNQTLMDELVKIEQTIKKIIPSSPHSSILVVDGTIGQTAVHQARNFAKAVDITGVIITKLDSSAKGGILVNIIKSLHVPIHFIGVGEKKEDLQQFSLQDYLKNLILLP